MVFPSAAKGSKKTVQKSTKTAKTGDKKRHKKRKEGSKEHYDQRTFSTDIYVR